MDPDRWEFANEYFLRGRRDLLGEIHRRKPSSSSGEKHQGKTIKAQQPEYAAIEVGAYGGLQAEVDSLKRDKTLLMQEVIRLRQAHQVAEDDIRVLSERMEMTEKRQQQMMAFLAQALQHPSLLQHYISSSPNIKRIEDGRRRKKKKRSNSDSEGSGDEVGDAAMVVHNSGNNSANVFQELAQAFTQMLTTNADDFDKYPKSRLPPHRRPGSSLYPSPMIEEAATSKGNSSTGLAKEMDMPTQSQISPENLQLSPVLANAGNQNTPFKMNGLTPDHQPQMWQSDNVLHGDAQKLPSLNLEDFDYDIAGIMPSGELMITESDIENFGEGLDMGSQGDT